MYLENTMTISVFVCMIGKYFNNYMMDGIQFIYMKKRLTLFRIIIRQRLKVQIQLHWHILFRKGFLMKKV